MLEFTAIYADAEKVSMTDFVGKAGKEMGSDKRQKTSYSSAKEDVIGSDQKRSQSLLSFLSCPGHEETG